MVKIRMMRMGSNNNPFYRVIAIDERKPRNGRPLEFLGTYDPTVNPPALKVDLESIDADTSTAEDDAFRFVGDAFSGAAGELRAYDRAGQTLVEADVDGNGLADFSFALNTTASLNEQDFLL